MTKLQFLIGSDMMLSDRMLNHLSCQKSPGTSCVGFLILWTDDAKIFKSSVLRFRAC